MSHHPVNTRRVDLKIVTQILHTCVFCKGVSLWGLVWFRTLSVHCFLLLAVVACIVLWLAGRS